MKKRLAPLMIAATLAASPLAAFDINAMSEAERSAFHAEIRAYLMTNPQVIFDAVDALKAQQAAEQAQNDVTLVKVNEADLFDDGFSWVGGNPDGDITMVEFLDYRCGYCRKAHGEVAELLATDGNIRLIVKEFPILGEASVLASRFAIATRQLESDEAYKQVNDALMNFTGDITETSLRRIGDTLGLNSDALIARMNDDSITDEIAQTRALAQRLEISGTPTFVMQDELLRGYVPLAQMQEIVAEKRSQNDG